MSVADEKSVEHVEKVDNNTQSNYKTSSTKQTCSLFRQRFQQCMQNVNVKNITDKVTNAYLQYPGLFIILLITIASVIIPTIVIISIIAINVAIGITVFVIIEAIVILSSATVMSFMFLIIAATLIMTGLSFFVIYLSAHWFISKLKHFRRNFFYDLLQY